ncbi:uncharacterized protein LOC101824127 isoform X2 [Mesocricetus auratus]|uniref:Uncharacterized protein LOC101824127 isoform X2 n=1 Tax=Mesocricetus auratus TaxID=10036 RepID=A0ABM2XN32_MESAU|nr:uncharacterized protein LOC101824127 isoform X2 [Mesocricetus auratus]
MYIFFRTSSFFFSPGCGVPGLGSLAYFSGSKVLTRMEDLVPDLPIGTKGVRTEDVPSWEPHCLLLPACWDLSISFRRNILINNVLDGVSGLLTNTVTSVLQNQVSPQVLAFRPRPGGDRRCCVLMTLSPVRCRFLFGSSVDTSS